MQKETLERAKRLFPELQEGKDERIRKAIIELVKQSSHILNPMNQKSMIAWLEKQGEHANFRNKIQIGDKVTRNTDGVLVNLSQLKRVAKNNENQCEQKPTWSEEDAINLNWVINVWNRLRRGGDAQTTRSQMEYLENWLKSLKDRVQAKVGLTQLDKNILEAAIAFVEQNNHFNCWCGVDKHTVLSALYSRRPQNTWKPSDEQMMALRRMKAAIAGEGEIYKPLNSLYQDLKKLKEE